MKGFRAGWTVPSAEGSEAGQGEGHVHACGGFERICRLRSSGGRLTDRVSSRAATANFLAQWQQEKGRKEKYLQQSSLARH